MLALEVDTAALLPKDDASHGFDNVTVAGLSPTLLDRYLSAAQKIARLAVGRTAGDEAVFIRLPADLTQEGHMPGLPLGTRGGAVIRHTYPVSGEYEVGVRLARDRNEEIEGLHEDHEMVVLLDRREAARFTISPPRGHRNFELVDQHLKVSLPVAAGPHELAVAFLKKGSSLHETKRQPYAARFNMHRHPRSAPAVYQVAIQGSRKAEPAKDTPTRRRIFGSALVGAEGTEDRAREILSRLMRQAYRRPITGEDVERAIAFYREGAKGGGFESGIETALAAILARRGLSGPGNAPGFDRASLLNPNGFTGIDGIFRFRPDGTAERGLAILEIRRKGATVIQNAPNTFQQQAVATQ